MREKESEAKDKTGSDDEHGRLRQLEEMNRQYQAQIAELSKQVEALQKASSSATSVGGGAATYLSELRSLNSVLHNIILALFVLSVFHLPFRRQQLSRGLLNPNRINTQVNSILRFNILEPHICYI